jgi:transposase
MKMLVFQRLLIPASKKKTYENRDYLFENTDYTLDDVYRCLSFLAVRKDAMLLWMHERIQKLYGRDTSIVYYDVTNYHFEIDGPQGYRKVKKNDDKRIPDGYRNKGVAKNHSPDPIVQMGLFIDNNAIPITYQTFPGNTNDCMTYRPNLYRIKSVFGISRAIVVADKAMCMGDNIWYTLSAKDGYVFSLSIRAASSKLQEYILDEKGYEWLGTDYKRKTRLEKRLIHIHTAGGGMMHKEVDERQVAFYSTKYDKRAKAERAPVIAKAKELISKPGNYTRATSYGAAGYIKNLKFDKKTGAILDTGIALLLDEDKIRNEEALDGYYMIVSSESDESADKIIDLYRGLWKIEESFRVLKHEFETRPIYVSRKDHIEAHFLTCFVALVISRILERETGHKYSIGEMLESLCNAQCTHIQQNYYLFDYTDDILNDIGHTYRIDFTKRIRTLGDIKKVFANVKKP